MTIRTMTKTVTFRQPFRLDGFDEVLPAGAYCVETDEELLEGISFPVYRRILTLIHLHETPGRPGVTRTWKIDPKELEAALERDQAPANMSAGGISDEESKRGASECSQEQEDRLALERGEDEGMVVHPRQTVPPRREQDIPS